MVDLKVLICDDSLLVRKKLKGSLYERGFTNLLEAADGAEAVALCRQEKPDLILMDIVMPILSGLEAVQEIRTFDPDVHIVMASSVGTQSNLIQAIKIGANNFLQKPIELEAIEEIAAKLTQERGAV